MDHDHPETVIEIVLDMQPSFHHPQISFFPSRESLGKRETTRSVRYLASTAVSLCLRQLTTRFLGTCVSTNAFKLKKTFCFVLLRTAFLTFGAILTVRPK